MCIWVGKRWFVREMRLGGTDSEWHLVRDMDSSGTEGLWKGTWYGRKSPAVRNTSAERFCTRNSERNV